jgi:hypothetical protein
MSQGQRSADPINFPKAEHPAEWSTTGAYFAPSDKAWTVSVDFRQDPGAGVSASIQFHENPNMGFIYDSSKGGLSFRTEDQPETEVGAFKFNLAGLSEEKLGALYGAVLDQFYSTGDERYKQLLDAVENQEKKNGGFMRWQNCHTAVTPSQCGTVTQTQTNGTTTQTLHDKK